MSGNLIVAAESPDYVVIDADAMAADLLGIPLQPVRGATLLEAVQTSPALRPLHAALRETLRTNAACHALVRSTQNDRRVECHVSVIPAPDGGQARSRIVVSPVQSVAETDTPPQIDAIVDLVSHELRSPLNATLIWASLLELDHAPATVEKAAAVIRENVKTQARLIDDLVDVARTDSSAYPSAASPLDFGEMLNRAITDARAALPLNIGVESAVDRSASRVLGDADRLLRVVHHLLRNAGNAMPDGGTIAVTAVTHGDHLTVDVADQGIGMSAADVSQTFRPFWRADGRRSGAGLGLGVVRKITAQHGGCVLARSAGTGLGSTFTFTLPIRRD